MKKRNFNPIDENSEFFTRKMFIEREEFHSQTLIVDSKQNFCKRYEQNLTFFIDTISCLIKNPRPH